MTMDNARRLTIIAISCCAMSGTADTTKAVTGRWASEGSIIEITRQEGELRAHVIALMEPVYTAAETGPEGTTRKDDKNPDASLQATPILGLQLLSNYTFDGKRWSGKIYDPESGNTYSSRMRVDRQGNLQMRGYIGVPLLGRTATFTSLQRCTAAMQTMLSRSGRAPC